MMTINQRAEESFPRPMTDRMSNLVPGSMSARRLGLPGTHMEGILPSTTGFPVLPPSIYPPPPPSPRFPGNFLPYQQGGIPDPAMLYQASLSGTGNAVDAWRANQLQAAAAAYYDPMSAHYGYPYGVLGLGEGARRKNATRETTSTLKAWLNEHRKNPYPTKAEKIMLAIVTRMTLTQVSTWFANARRRLKKENKMTWSPRNRCGEDDDDEIEDSHLMGGGGSAANDMSSRTSSPILVDVDDNNPHNSNSLRFSLLNPGNQNGARERLMTSPTGDDVFSREKPFTSANEVSAGSKPTLNQLHCRQGSSYSNFSVKSPPVNKNQDVASTELTKTTSTISPKFPYDQYQTHPFNNSKFPSTSVQATFQQKTTSTSNNFPDIKLTSAFSNSSPAGPTPVGNSIFPLNHMHPAFQAQAASLFRSGAHGLNPQLLAVFNEQAQLHRSYQQAQLQQIMACSPASLASFKNSNFRRPSDQVASSTQVSPSIGPITKPKIWSIADVASKDDSEDKRKSSGERTESVQQAKEEKLKQVAQSYENSASSFKWMEQMLSNRNQHFSLQQVGQLKHGVPQTALYPHHPMFSSLQPVSKKPLVSESLLGLASYMPSNGENHVTEKEISSTSMSTSPLSKIGSPSSVTTKNNEIIPKITIKKE